MTVSRKVTALASGAIAAGLLAIGASPVWAEPVGRIQEVKSTPGVVSLVLAAEGLSEGQTIDPESVTTTIGGIEAPAEAVPLTEEAAPITRTAMLVMDSSGSMAEFDKISTAKQSARLYVESLPPDVRLGLISFADEAKVDVAPTEDRAAVLAAIDALTANGATALNDAVVLATEALGAEGSRNALLLSDGKDEGSEASAKEARNTLSDSGVTLDAVALGRGDQEKQLAAFAKAGNGTVVTATNSAELTQAFESAARSVATQLAVTATVPEGIEAGTKEVVVNAVAGGAPITDQVAAIIEPAAAPSPTENAFGPKPVDSPTSTPLSGTWVMIAAIVLLFVGLLGISAFAIGAIDASNRKQGRVARRLDEVSIDGSAPVAPSTEPSSALGSSSATRGLVSFADRVAQGRDTTAISRKLESAGVPLRPAEWVVIHGLIALAAALVVTLLSNFNLLIALIALILGLLLPWLFLSVRADRRRKAFYDAIPDSMQMLAGSLAAGYSLPQGLELLARDVEGPFGQEINRALLESRLGLPLTESLEAVAQRMQSQDFHWVVLSIRTHSLVGGNLAEVLTNVAHTLRERERLRRQVRSLTAEGRISTWIVAILPIFLLVFFALFRRDYLDVLITRPIGWVILAVGAVFYAVGILWVRKLVNMEV